MKADGPHAQRCVCVYACTCVCVRLYMYECVECVRTCIVILCVYVCVYVCVCMCVCVCVCVCVLSGIHSELPIKGLGVQGQPVVIWCSVFLLAAVAAVTI